MNSSFFKGNSLTKVSLMLCKKTPEGSRPAAHLLAMMCFISSMNAFSKKPHIIVIMADDLGWNDVSFHGSDQILTPNIDALAYNGVILHQHYSQQLCTPSRAAFLTGRYPLHIGMQHNLILEPEPWGLPLHFKLMPQYLNTLGYQSHAVGKWHLGYFKKDYTPTHRGFHSHFGFWNGHQDYYKHTVQASFTNYEGYDMRFNSTVTWDGVGQYSTDLFTQRAVNIISQHDASQPLFLYMAHLAPHAGNYDDPLQAPREHIDKFKHILKLERRTYAGMVSKLDESVGKVVEALNSAAMLKDSIIIFLSDNGGATTGFHVNHGSNWPLKGEKGTLWEGSIRTVSCIWSPLIQQGQRVFHHIMHISDWLPTLYSAAGGKYEDLGNVDGVDQWAALITDSPRHARHEILHNIDEQTGNVAIRVGQLKYVNGTTILGSLDGRAKTEEYTYQLPFDTYAEHILNSTTNKHLSVFNKNNSKSLIHTKIKKIRDSIRIKCKVSDGFKNKENTLKCNLQEKPCIFNIVKDPCEQENLYSKMKSTGIIQDFENRLKRQKKNALKPQNRPADPRSNPNLHNYTWISWED